MKASKIREVLNEYDRVDELVNEIEKHLENFSKIGKKKKNQEWCWHSVGNMIFTVSDETKTHEPVNITISPELSKVIKEEIRKILTEKYVELQDYRNKLEVQTNH